MKAMAISRTTPSSSLVNGMCRALRQARKEVIDVFLEDMQAQSCTAVIAIVDKPVNIKKVVSSNTVPWAPEKHRQVDLSRLWWIIPLLIMCFLSCGTFIAYASRGK